MENKPIRAYDKFRTNIKGLPYNPEQPGSNQYMTETGYSQTYPWKVVWVSPSGKTCKVVPVEIARDPEWTEKMDWRAGGFAGNCANQSDQTWLYNGVRLGVEPVTLRLKKSRYAGSDKLWGDKYGREFIANGCVYFYDYNF